MLFFFILLMIEFHQDQSMNKKYQRIKKTKVSLKDGFFECQSCGNTAVKSQDKYCKNCGINFVEEDHDHTPSP